MVTSDISTLKPKLSKVFLIIAEFIIVSPAKAFPWSSSNKSKGGILYSPTETLEAGTSFDFKSKDIF